MEIKSGETDKNSQSGDCGMGVELEVSHNKECWA